MEKIRPLVERYNSKDFTEYILKKVCNHKPPCQSLISVVIHDGGFMICESDAKEFGVDILYKAKAIRSEKDITYRNMEGWTFQEEQLLIDWIKSKGVYYGVYREIAEALNRTRNQVKKKAEYLREKGVL